MTCSRIRLKPTIKKIVITDRRGTEVFKVEVSGLIDAETRNIASMILCKLEDRGYEPKLDIELITSSPSDSDRSV